MKTAGMQHLTISVIRDITDGEASCALPSDEITAITTDSRALTPGCLFAAIPGARVDGHDFIAAAAQAGASCVLCNRFVDAAIPQIKVPDTQLALRQIAAFYRCQFDIPFVGVTGSVGKTTAKEMIASVLSARFDTLRTEKNFNNELGVPLTLFRLRAGHEAAVVEMGISGFGEMTRLTDMVRPSIAVFTLIGDAHLEFLGDRAGVLRAKGEIVSGMPEDGVVIANGDDELLKAHDFGRRTVLFGTGEHCDVRAVEVENDGLNGMRCVILAGDRRIPVGIPAFGRHMIYAALMGAAVGLELGLTDEEIRTGVARFQNVGSRGRVVTTGYCTILDDCYNANPTSTKAAVDSLAMLPGRHVAILGDMLELGENGPALHAELGRYAAGTGAKVVTCGALSKHTADGAGETARWFPDTASLIAALPEIIRRGDAVLVKASHSMGFDAVVRAVSQINGTE
ncbi:MAG: UDP-N-acetylmuramoyl-tripeptide--D-alanyl-D-alanine ligase [Oscillospiraceae bacterium]